MKNFSSGGELSDVEIIDQLFSDPFFLGYECGKYTPQEFYQNISKHLNQDLSFSEFVHQWNDVFKRNVAMENIFFELTGKYPVGLLSDIDSIHWEYVRKNFSFLKKIQKPVLSFELGQVKPHPSCYKEAALSINKPIENCLFIDDRLKNVNGAIATGMQAIHFKSADQLIIDLAELDIKLDL